MKSSESFKRLKYVHSVGYKILNWVPPQLLVSIPVRGEL